MATLIRPGQLPEPVSPKVGEVFTLTELHQLLGGWVEAIYFPAGAVFNELVFPAEIVMLVNEEGKLHNLPYNDGATSIARLNKALLAPDDFIVGPAIIVTRQELGEDDDDESEE